MSEARQEGGGCRITKGPTEYGGQKESEQRPSKRSLEERKRKQGYGNQSLKKRLVEGGYRSYKGFNDRLMKRKRQRAETFQKQISEDRQSRDLRKISLKTDWETACRKPTQNSLERDRDKKRDRDLSNSSLKTVGEEEGAELQKGLQSKEDRERESKQRHLWKRQTEKERCFLIIECKFPRKSSSSKPQTRQKQTDNLADAGWVLQEGGVYIV